MNENIQEQDNNYQELDTITNEILTLIHEGVNVTDSIFIEKYRQAKEICKTSKERLVLDIKIQESFEL